MSGDAAARAAGLSASKQALLARMLEGRRAGTSAAGAIPLRVGAGPSPLSFAQQRLWFVHQIVPSSPAYNVPNALRLRGALDTGVLGRCLSEVVRRHQSLRTRFEVAGGVPVQVVDPARRAEIPLLDLSGLRHPAREEEARRLAGEEAAAPFDLLRGPLLRARLLRLAADDHVFLLTMHHIVSDGWSMGVLVREIAALYGAFVEGRPSPLWELPVQYADFAVWQRQKLAGDRIEEELAWWRERLLPLPPALELPADRPRPPVPTFRGGSERVSIPTGVAAELRALARAENATLFMTLLAAFEALLVRLTGEEDVAVGTVVANRTLSEVEPLIGFFVNTLVLRVDGSGDPTFRTLLGRARETTLGAFAHQDLPFERLVEELQPARDLSRNPIFQVAIALQNAPADLFELRGLSIGPFPFETGTSRFDLELHLWEEAGGGIEGMLLYAADQFDPATIRRLAERYAVLLASVGKSPDRRVSELPLLAAGEAERILVSWNDTQRDYPRDSTIAEIFDRIARERADEVALVFEGGATTYAELRDRAFGVARALAARGVRAERRVGLAMDRSPELVTAILGVLFAGGAYVPVDPESPPERTARMLADAGVSLLVTDGRAEPVEGTIDAVSFGALARGDRGTESRAGQGAGAPLPAGFPDALAYVMFTSGSTGTPKGIEVTNRNVLRLVLGTEYARFGPGETILQLAPVAFDASTFEIWGALLNGGRLAIAAPGAASPAEIMGLCERFGATTIWLTAGLFHVAVDEEPAALARLSQVLAGGDVLSPARVRALLDAGCPRVVNGYGPTETTTFACCEIVEPGDVIGERVPIGRPIANARVYILDASLGPAPAGARGELYVGGDGVSRGYARRPDLTAERFLPDPFGPPGSRLYRTGDLARFRGDGRIEFLGRRDGQAKVRGFRVEVGEVEAALVSTPGVRAAAVVAEGGAGAAELVAYVVPETGEEGDTTGLRKALAGRLPRYMIPTRFGFLDALPLTSSGKIDRRRLSALGARTRRETGTVEPRTAAEREVARIWAELLGIDRVGATDNFFELGGHSLLATRVTSRLRASLGIEVPLRALFEAPTVEALASVLESTAPSTREGRIPRRERDGPVPLSFAQQRLWFLQALQPAMAAYNIPNVLRLEGRLDVAALGRAFTEIVRRHESLRTRFVEGPGGPEQIVDAPAELRIRIDDVASEPDPVARARTIVADEALRPFDLARGPLVRAHLVRLGADDHLLLLTMHHIVSDGWSMGVLVSEVATLYGAFALGRPSSLPDLPIQYADFSVWQRRTISGERLEEELAYWREDLASLPPPLEVPSDRPRPPVQTFRGGLAALSIPPVAARSLRALAEENGATLFMALLAAFDALLARLTGVEDVVVGTGIANRTFLELEPLIGFFVNTLVMRVDCSRDPSFRELLDRVRRKTLAAFAHQDLPFERLVEELQPTRDLARNPVVQVAFALQNTPGGVFDLPGLSIGPFPFDSWTTRFDLELHLWEEGGGGIGGSLFYAADLFDEATARRLADRYTTLLASIAQDPERPLSSLRLETDEEIGLTERLLVRGAELRVAPRPVHELFEERATRNPGIPALVQGDRSLTYGELDAAAARLAAELRRGGVGRGARVAILAPRSIEQTTAVLAVTKTGGAYVPIDPANPDPRIALILEGSGARTVLAPRAHSARLPAGARWVEIPELTGGARRGDHRAESSPDGGPAGAPLGAGTGGEGESAGAEDRERTALARGRREEPDERQAEERRPEAGDLAYVIFTSGSTGDPNGVEVTHANLANLVAWHRAEFGVGEGDRATLVAGVGFDASVWELWPSLASGACLLLPDDATRLDPPALRDWIVDTGVTIAFLPTPLAERVLRLDWPRPCTLRMLLTGGDRLHAIDTSRLPFRVANNYGPTETTVVATSGLVDAGASRPAPTIGRPIANARVRVLDPTMRPVPLGAAGELYIGGAGVARGYAGRPDLTAERFLPDPDPKIPGARVYRTGDRVRQLADGRLEFLGRVDAQVKVRGYRIEPAEVETVLAHAPGVEAAAVVAREEGGETRLVAYVSPRREGGIRSVWEEEHIARWRDLYDETYRATPGQQDPFFNITGWNSSYTGAPIDPAEMREWREKTVERILALGPRRVLEIGCGTGLLLSQLAPRCERYVATDFSRVSLEFVRGAIAAREELAHVVLLERGADDFGGLEPHAFDTIVLNSVAQYFPDAVYLERVLEGALLAVAEGGHVFVGDVRDARLHRVFAASVALAGAPDEGEAAAVRARAERIVESEEELLVSPAFFAAVAARSPRAVWAEALVKRGRADNELTRFRYDAVLHLGSPPIRSAAREIVWNEAARSLIAEAFGSGADEVVVRGVPNARLAGEIVRTSALADAAEGVTVGALRTAGRVRESWHPDDVVDLGGPWWIGSAGLAADRADVFDVAYIRAGPGASPAALALPAPEGEPRAKLTNLPLRATIAAALVPRLREVAAARLPEFMLPSVYVVLDALPLTPNGKIDRRALPAPGGAVRTGKEVVPPRTETEDRMARIWAELLGLERVGVTDDFFELGGHSLLATQLVSRMRSGLGVEIPLRAVFESPTVAGLAALVETTVTGPRAPGRIPRAVRGAFLPLSFAQERLWFLDRLEPGGAGYNIPSALRLRGALDTSALGRAFAEIVRRHEALRTRFVEGPDGPEQVIDAPSGPEMDLIDLGAAEDPETEARRLLEEEALRPFDLARGPLFRSRLLRLAPNHHILLVTMHHIVSDGWSMGVLVREAGALYEAFAAGRPSPLPELPIQYADFALWQRKSLAGEALDREVAYWRERLTPLPPPLELPLDRPRPVLQGRRGARLRGTIDAPLADRLRALGRAEGATLHMVLLAAYATVLGRWAGEEEFAVGTPVANRTREETEGMIGFFINTLVLRMKLGGERASFRDLLGRIREEALGAYAHQEIPFESLVEALKPPRDLSRSPIFQVWFNHVNVPEEEPRFGALEVTPLGAATTEALFDLSLYGLEAGPAILLDAVYDPDLFDSWRIEELLAQIALVLGEAVDEPGRSLADISLLTPRARTELPDPRTALSEAWLGAVPDLVARRAASNPDTVAVVDPLDAWTYKELDRRANQLARRLATFGVRKGDAVAIWAHRSASTVWAILGALKAGAAITMLDPAHPEARLIACLEEARPTAFVEVEAAGPPPDALVAMVEGRLGAARLGLPPRRDLDAIDPLAGVSDAPVGRVLGPDDVACITFTSGSTGKPKGVRGRHGSLSHFQPFLERRFGFGPDDRVSLLSGLAHDPLQRDVFTTLMTGGAIVIPDPADLDPARLAPWAARERVSVMHLTPAMAKILAGGMEVSGPLEDLRLVLLVGEALTRRDVLRLRALAPGATIVNLYGTTETQRAVGHYVIPPGEPLRGEDGSAIHREMVPVGVGMEDVQLLIRGEGGRAAGLGELGEVWVRSPHLALGYHDETLTRARFVGEGAGRAYRTGDLGRYLPGGVVLVAGRRDDQVNVRGFRVELGEIEAALGAEPGVRDAAAALDGEGRLVGYVTPRPGASLDPTAVRAGTRRRLPEAMVPAAVVVLDALPLTPNGKVDRRALPAPSWRTAGEPAVPRTPEEEIACALFEEVLGLPRVGTTDGFFDLGGHSLLATRLVSRVRSRFGVEVSLRSVFEAPTPAGLARAVIASRRRGEGPPPVTPAPVQARRRASYAQLRLWFLDRLFPGSAVYNLPTALRLTGALDAEALGRALAELERRHEALRTRIVSGTEGPEQVFDAPRAIVLETEDLRTAADPEGETLARIAGEAARPFDLARGPLWRARLSRVAERVHLLSLVFHHIVTDGWSMDVLVRDLVVLYGAYAAGRPSPLADLTVQYADWAAWQRAWLEGGELERQLDWWRRRLDGVRPLDLPTDRPRPARRGLRGAEVGFEVPAETAGALAGFARKEGATLFHVLLSCFQALLARYAGEEDIVVGTPVANRTVAEAEPIVGFFVNTLPVRTRVEAGTTLRALVARVREATLDAYAHQDAPFESIVEALRLERDLARSPVFDAVFALRRAGSRPGGAGDLLVEPLAAMTGAAGFDLSLSMVESEGRLVGSLEYDADLFETATAERLVGYFTALARALARDPEERLDEVELRSAAERDLVERTNATSVARPERCAHELVEERTLTDPRAIAVVSEEGSLTYLELEERSNRIAHRLRRAGIGPEDGVGLLDGRSARAIEGMLGIWKSGGVLVPLDAALPAARLETILTRGRVRALVAEREIDRAHPGYGLPVVRLDTSELDDESAARPSPLARPANAACVIFTSGSTGEPKGVVLEHGALADHALTAAESWSLGPGDRFLRILSPLFDGALDEVVPVLASGATVVVQPDPLGDTPAGLLARCSRGRITAIFPSVGLMHELADDVARRGAELPGSLRLVVTGGESPGSGRIATLLRASGARLLYVNVYGPTETTVFATSRLVAGDTVPDPVPLGRAMANVTAHLLDARMAPVPIGAAGEVYIGGVGVARGYAGRPAETAAAFVPDPFAGRPGGRLYRTGDLARRLADGELVYLGRRDGQVKLRGFRIELGEVEAALARVAGVREAAAGLRRGGRGAYLAAWVVPSEGKGPGAARVRDAVREWLPEFMVPSVVTVLGAMPRTATGKIDRRALPAPEWGLSMGEGAGARTPEEAIACALFADVLDVGRVGIDDGFFDLGGHSLLAARLVSRVRERLGAEIALRDLFEAPTPAGLAKAVVAARRRGVSIPPPVVRADAAARRRLSYSQQRLWFLEGLFPGTPVHNVPTALRLSGSLDVVALSRALADLERRHEALRTRIVAGPEGPEQVFDPPRESLLQIEDLTAAADPDAEARGRVRAEASAPFDLERGPLWRVRLLRTGEAVHVLSIVLHHIVTDGWSMDVLTRELALLYGAYAEGRSSPLPEPVLQYADWAAWQRRWLEGGEMERQLGYWKRVLEGATPLGLPTDRPRPPRRGLRGAHVTFEIGATETAELGRLAREQGATLFHVLLASFQALLARWSASEEVVVGTPVANRTVAESEPIVGFFANTLAIRTWFQPGASLRWLVGQVRETTLEAYAHQDAPFEAVVDRLGVERDLSRNPLFDVMFSLQQAERGPAASTGLVMETIPAPKGTASFDLVLTVAETDGRLAGSLEYDADLFEPETAERLVARYAAFLAAGVAAPDAPLGDHDLRTDGERALEARTNATAVARPERCIHELVAEAAAGAPEALAVLAEDRSLTYAELGAWANRVARRLRREGIGPEIGVGLLAGRTAGSIAGILGILEAGGVVVPLDPSFPAARVGRMLQDGGVRALLADRLSEPLLRAAGLPIVRLDADAVESESDAPVPPLARPANAAFLMFTSGSTGEPKGSIIEHRSLADRMLYWVREQRLVPGDRVLHFLGPVFDWALEEILPALAAGAAVVVHPDPFADAPAQLLERCGRAGVTILNLPAGILHEIGDDLARSGASLPSSIRLILTGGESPSGARIAAVLRAAPGPLVVTNGYGPTETTVDTTAHHMRRPEEVSDPVPIGLPLENTTAHLLDARLRPVPVGGVGELCVGGIGVARGYAGRSAETAAVFVPDPFSDEPGARLYRTGDLARRLPGGELVFIGRRDRQVKVHGHRIELGEVESALARVPGVREAAAGVRLGRTGESLVAWVVASEPGALDAAGVISALRERLPQFMVPSIVTILDAMPRTVTGKTDRRALGAPDAVSATRPGPAPRTAEEDAASALFAEVLDLPRVGIDEDFFDLGGHSLLAARLLSMVRARIGVEVTLRDLFEAPTPAGLARAIVAARHRETETPPPIGRAPESERRRLSYAQQRLWFLDRLFPRSAGYNVPTALRLTGDLDARALGRALDELERRHESLRTRIVPRTEGPETVFDPPRHGVMEVCDLTGGPAPEEEAVRLLDIEAADPFDLERGPLWRARLYRTGARAHILSLVLHHVVTDGWSMDLLIRELTLLYDAFSEGRPSPLAEPTIQYADWAAWQRRWLEAGEMERQLSYWRRELDGVEPLALPTDRPRPSRRGLRGSRFVFEIGVEETKAITALAHRQGATLFHALLGSFQGLLARWAATDDVVVGTPVANRAAAESEPLVGFFANTLAIRTRVAPGATLRELVGRVRETTLEAYAHQDAPFEAVVEALEPERNLSRNPLFDVMFSLRQPDVPIAGTGGLALEGLPPSRKTATFDLSLTITETGDRLAGSIEYDMDLFDRATAERLAGGYVGVVRSALEDPDAPLGDLDLRTAAERDLEARSNATRVERPECCAHELVEARALQNPRAIAVASENASLTYGELEALANRIARRLRREGIGPEIGVGLLAGRTVSSIAGILGIWKSGGVLVPLDAALPSVRLVAMIEGARVGALVTEEGLDRAIPGASFPVIRLDAPDLESESAAPVPPLARPSNAAYVIFTSGSTGEPKGVVVEHRSIADRARAAAGWMGLGAEDRVLYFLSPLFDGSLDDLLPTLASGARVVVDPDPKRESGAGFLARCAAEGVTVAHPSVGFLHEIADDLSRGTSQMPPCLRLIVTGGERPDAGRIEALLRAGRGAVGFMNAYGPTETTIDATVFAATPEGAPPDPLPIGRPVENTTAHLLDGRMRAVPLGAVGEIFIGGIGVARGYAGHPAETAETFVPDPFAAEPGGRLYRTGDLGRRLASGDLVFLERRDGQVKLRGYRIELGEIESALARVAGVQEGAVKVFEGAAGAFLAAYVVPAGGEEIDASRIKSALGEMLPGYMVPAVVELLDSMPRTATDKIDRRALPAPGQVAGRHGRVAPRDELERRLKGVCAQVLGVPDLGVEDDFFERGGHSLLAVRLVSAIAREHGVELPVASLFREPTVAGLARLVRGGLGEISALLTLRRGTGAPPLVCVHGIGGGVSDFAELAPHLDPRRPLLAVHALDSAELTKVEDQAARCFEAITRGVPEGPIDLLGWSYGCLVAIETALRLREADHPVRTLVLVDGSAPDPGRRPPQTGSALSRVAAACWGYLREDADTAAAVAAGRAAGAIPAGLDDADAAEWLLGIAGRLDAADDYVPRPYQGDVLLVRATGTRVSRQRGAEDFGWRRWVSGTFTIAWVEGSHFSIVQEGGGARALATLIERHVARLRPASARKGRGRSVGKRTQNERAPD